MRELINFPPLMLPFNRKNKEWKRHVLDWADSRTFFNYSLVRQSVIHKKIAYDLVAGILHMQDLEMILNPDLLSTNLIPELIQHYAILNSKLDVLRGEESKRVFDYRVIVTNPNDISEIENEKKQLIMEKLQALVEQQQNSLDEQQYNQELDKINDYFTYEWQDLRELRANQLLNHYSRELEFSVTFNSGFMDAMVGGEEIYQCDIIGGEPKLFKLNPLKLRCFKAGYSNRIEDADIIIYEDYWSPGRVYDEYYDVLSDSDRKYLEGHEDHFGLPVTDSLDNIDERFGFVNSAMVGDQITSTDGFFFDPVGETSGISNSLLPFDTLGNVRVLKVYWKSKKKIKKVKHYDPETGEEMFDFYSENYVIDESMGEEEEVYWINEAWEGTKIGDSIYVNIRPRPVLYNRLSNPSECHFGIIGSVYNLNEGKPFSLVDKMKPYVYLYDVIHDRLNKMLAKNWGKIMRLDLAKIPKGWEMDKWLYFAKVNNIAIEDSFKEGMGGAAQGKLAGGLNNASNGVIDADLTLSIQQYMGLLSFISEELSNVAGISKQREGQISNRETVGGVERATLQSSHITEWLFTIHDSVKKRAMECFLETAKIALRGRSKKFTYILNDGTERIMDIDGDEFAESDYGLVVDNSTLTQELNQRLDTIVQAGLQNQMLSFSSALKIYTSISTADKIRLIEKDEQQIKQQQQEAQLQQQQQLQQQMQMQMQLAQMEFQQKDTLNQRDNETKILVAEIQANAATLTALMNNDTKQLIASSQDNSMEQMKFFESLRQFDEQNAEKKRQFDTSNAAEQKKLELLREKNQQDHDVKLRQLRIQANKPTSSK